MSNEGAKCKDDGLALITESELASYVVCPHSWHLKHNSQSPVYATQSPHSAKSNRLKSQWHENKQLLTQLRYYGRNVYLLLLVILVSLIFLEQLNLSLNFGSNARQFFQSVFIGSDRDSVYNSAYNSAYSGELPPEASTYPNSDPNSPPNGHRDTVHDLPSSIPVNLLLLLLLLGALTWVYDSLDRKQKEIAIETGFSDRSSSNIKSRSHLLAPSIVLRSTELNLIAHPDAIIEENNSLIPVLYQPLGKKIHDRHVIRIVASLRLLEEQLGKRPAHGLIILGEGERTVRIAYTDEKKRWLEQIVAEINAARSQLCTPLAFPSKFKCKNCDVNSLCKFKHGEFKYDSTLNDFRKE